MEPNTSIQQTLQTQIEYYLSDKNLVRDRFFHEQIAESNDGYIDIQLFLKCNKVRTLGATFGQLVQAAQDSDQLELNEDKTKVRRKDNKALPDFQGQKKLKVQEVPEGVPVTQEEGAPEVQAPPQEEVEDPKTFTPLVLFVRRVEGLEVRGRELEEAIGKKYMIKIPFARIGKSDGHLILDKFNTPKETVDELVKSGFDHSGKVIEFDLGTDRDRSLFMKDHGRHVAKIVEKKFGKKFGQPKKEVNRKLSGPVIFMERKYPNMEALKAVFKGIVMKTRNGQIVTDEAKAKLTELLKSHDKGEEKLQGLKDFTVGFHPTYNKTRCFFVIKEDGTKEDFSFHKCVHNLVAQAPKKI